MRIHIRHPELDDYEALHKIYTGPKVVWGTLQLPFTPTERQRKRLAEPREGSYVLVACVDGDMIGHLHLETFPMSPRRKHVGHIGMSVHDEWQGKGVGTALMEATIDFADKWLNLTRLELSVFTDNAPGIRLYEKFGFETEGTLKQFAYRDGQFVDGYFLGRIKQDD